MTISRRDFIRAMALNSAAIAATTMFPGIIFAGWKPTDLPADSIKWGKTPCRFCGTGCGLLVGVSGEKAVAVKGDPNCSVNKGLCCVKGYHSIQILYGKDRFTTAYVRKNGKLVPTPIDKALDLVASKMKESIKKTGKDSVSIYGSGQWSIPDGYAASKFFKGCLGTNNVEANARLCMASAVTGCLTTFGLDEPMGCYEDIDNADVFITWGNNMAEMHPVLFSRMLANRKSKTHVKIIDLTTRSTRSSQAADKSMLFNPQSDLAIANAICYEIIKNNWVNKDFVTKHVSFHKGKTNIGYGTEDHFKFKDKGETVDFKAYKEFLKDYTPEKAEKISGVSAEDIKYLAALYGDPSKKVTSFWTMGMNQHTRGTW
ncbi:MAG: molybdopterin-dependent oxidoreductase, partial [Desulfobacteraceae bacterium]|nr:molybdopterin-dependent oxidoreductase [Desulfobacteraceae bacterium]